jgi:hypothetical protein
MIKMAYDDRERSAVLTFPDGRTLKLSNVTRERAQRFLDRHAREFERRDLCLVTPSPSSVP